jgi:diguanylate cyclase (GGDEF)-like protein/PAS domain S-box-containing protein
MKAKILFIEDDKIDQKAFKRLVEKQQLPYEYVLVESVKDAKKHLKTDNFDIVLMDYMLTDGTAFDIFDSLVEMPFVMLTGSGDEEVAVKAMKSGALDYLIKDPERNYLKVLPVVIENALKHHKDEKMFKMLSHAVMDIKDSVYFTDMEDIIIYVNDAFCRTYGYREEEIVGKNASILWNKETENEYRLSIFPKALRGGLKGEFLHRKQDGSLFPVLLSRAVIKDERKNDIALAGIVRDITERKMIEQQFQSLAHYDSLTSLPNRAYMIERLSQSLVQARWNNYTLALLFVDLDNFKKINDTLGHDTGDKMLKEVALRLIECVRDSDTVARMGGDEFMIILPRITRAQDAAIIAQRIIDSLMAPFDLDKQECSIGASIGISQFPIDGDDYETLVKNADIAMYKAKDIGKNNYQFYNSAMNVAAFEYLVLENKLRKAIERDEFLIHYQPQIDLKTNKIVGVEALIRWKDPDSEELINARQFIPIAEETGLIISIGEWLLKTVCKQNMAWQEAGYSPMNMAINMSGRQFKQQKIVNMISDELEKTGLDSQYLELELTESILLQTEVTSGILEKFADLGIKLSIDDFGTGYSSLSYLKKLPISKLKIDQSFIRGISKNASDREIIKAIITMSHSLNIKVVAEGVEYENQLNFLRELGCDIAQGYLFCYPIPAEKLSELLSKEQPAIFIPQAN